MKRWIAIAIGSILILVILYYFWFAQIITIGSSNISTKGAATITTASTATTGAITGAESTLQTLGSNIAGAVANAEQSAKQAIATTLGITPTVVVVPATTDSSIAVSSSDEISTNVNATAGSANTSGNGKFTVCSINKKKTSQTYLIQNLLSPNQGLSYKADWGDGMITTGTIQSSQQSVSVSHTYTASGIYNVVFYATAGSTISEINEQACVQ